MIGVEFSNWQALPPPYAHRSASPNLIQIMWDLEERWPGFFSQGCYGPRPIRGGTAPSSHQYGAAIDCGYPAALDPVVADEVCPFLVARSHELHVQAVHDYRRSRIWRAARTPHTADACTAWWRAQRRSQTTGMGQEWCNHLHIETTPSGWAIDTPVAERWDGP